MIAVCTDNAKSNIAALNHKKNSAQQLSGEHFIRQPCAAHTANLAIKDTFESDDDFGFVSAVIDFLISTKPERSITEGFSPRFHTERWISLYTCTQFVRKKLNLYQNLTNQEIDEAIKLIENSIGWENLENILQIMWILIEKMERNYSSIADIVPSYLEAFNHLNEIQTEASQKMSNNLKKRFYETLSMNLPMLAFMFTKNGLEYFHEFQHSDENILKSALNGLIGYQRERELNKINIELNRIAFINYIKNFDSSQFDNFSSAIEFWTQYAKSNDEKIISSRFVNFIIEILQIPSSEAAVEKIFSVLSRLTRAEMCNSHCESLNARLIVKFDSIFKEAGAFTWENFNEKLVTISI